MFLRSIIYLTFVYLTFSALTIQQYPQYQLETPQLVFQDIQYSQKINYPHINKLVFITPWNNNGKVLTIKYAHKLTYISPCWYQLTIKNKKIAFQNDQLHDQKYFKEIKQANPNIKIIPRVYVNNFQVFRALGSDVKNFENLISLITETIKKRGYDGIVWDSPYNTFVKDPKVAPLNQIIAQFVNTLKNKIRNNILFYNMANPAGRSLDNNLYQNLNIDGLLIQNYDSSLNYIELIKRSINWVQSINMKTKNIIMLLPFFSYKNNQGYSTQQVAKQLKKQGISFSGFDLGMCKFISQSRNKYIVPCYKYFSEAYSILNKKKYSVGYWQGGNGLQNYYLFM